MGAFPATCFFEVSHEVLALCEIDKGFGAKLFAQSALVGSGIESDDAETYGGGVLDG